MLCVTLGKGLSTSGPQRVRETEAGFGVDGEGAGRTEPGGHPSPRPQASQVQKGDVRREVPKGATLSFLRLPSDPSWLLAFHLLDAISGHPFPWSKPAIKTIPGMRGAR